MYALTDCGLIIDVPACPLDELLDALDALAMLIEEQEEMGEGDIAFLD